MRIAYITGSFIPSGQANSVQVMKMCQALGLSGHDVTLFAHTGPDPGDAFERYGVERVFKLHTRARGTSPASRAVSQGMLVADLWRFATPDIFISRRPAHLLLVAGRGRPLVMEAHAMPLNRREQLTLDALFRLPNFTRLVCISGALRDDMLADYRHLSPAKVVVAHDAGDPNEVAAPRSVAELGGRDGCVQVGYVGSLYRRRGIETILECAARIPECDFHVVGGSTAEIAEWREFGAAANLHFHGRVPHSEVPGYHAAFDVLLAPYPESVGCAGGQSDIGRWLSPLKLFEYMAAGRAIVCSDRPVLREVLEPEVTALMPRWDDLDGWEAAIRRLALDAELRTRLGSAARAELVSKYTWEQRARAIMDFSR